MVNGASNLFCQQTVTVRSLFEDSSGQDVLSKIRQLKEQNMLVEDLMLWVNNSLRPEKVVVASPTKATVESSEDDDLRVSSPYAIAPFAERLRHVQV